MPGKKVAALRSIGILFLYLILGLLGIILVLSLVFSLNPLNFFKEIHRSTVSTITYVTLLYVLILWAVSYRAGKEDFGGLKGLGLSFSEKTSGQAITAALLTGLFFTAYFVLLQMSGAAHLDMSRPWILVLFKGLIFGFLFAFVEEIFFRGYLLQTLLKGFSTPVAFTAAGAFFSILHLLRPGNIIFKSIYFLGLFVLALVLSHAWQKTRSLWPSIALHGTLVAGMYVYSSTVVFNPAVYDRYAWIWGLEHVPLAGLAGIVMLGLLWWSLVRNVKGSC